MNLQQSTASALLELWEQAYSQSPIARRRTLIAAGLPKDKPEALDQLSLGQCNFTLLKLRERLLGNELISVAPCPNCQEMAEVQLNTTMLYQDYVAPAIQEIPFSVEDYHGLLQLLTFKNLVALDTVNDLATAQQLLLNSCLISLKQEETIIAVDQLSPVVIEVIAATLLAADPLAEIQLTLLCAACQENWQVGLDMATFLWQEVEQQARQLLNELHVLASTYSWSEADILALSPARRKFYLERIYR